MKLINLRPYLILFMIWVVATSSFADEGRTFRVINASNGLADNSAEVVACTKTGRMVISTIGNINFYDGTSFSHINSELENQLPLQLYRGGYRVFFDRKHHLWLKNTNTLSCVDLMEEKFVSDVDSVIRQMGCQSSVLDIFSEIDSSRVWFLTEDGLYGVVQKKTYQVLRDRNLQDVDVYANKTLLAFYDNGEEVGIDLATGTVDHHTQAYDDWASIEKYNHSSHILSHKGDYYQIRSGVKESVLLHFDVKARKWTRLLEVPCLLNNLALFEDRIYVAAQQGYFVYSIATGAIEHVEQVTLSGGQTMRTACHTIAFDKQGGMWIGTYERGLLYGRPMSSPFRVYGYDDPLARKYADMMEGMTQTITEFNGKKANCMFTDSRGWSWFGTTTGAYLYRTPKSEPVVFNKESGLYNNVVHAVVEDTFHNIWLSTSCGISCIIFNGEKPVFVNSFGRDDNVPNESFQNSKALCLDDGTIVMQGIDHVVTFQPKDFEMVNSSKPVVIFPKLVRILVNGNVVQPGVALNDNVVIDRAVSRCRDIYLKAEQNSLSLLFSGLNYFRPRQTYYRVRVKGLDSEWRIYSYFDENSLVDEQGVLHLPLAGLLPAVYEVEVQASMNPAVWEGEPYRWIVHVDQPWWLTQGMLMLLFILLVVLMGVNFFIYNKNMKLQLRRDSEEGDTVRKIRSFVDRCESFKGQLLSPMQEDGTYSDADSRNVLSPQFIELMLKVVPYVLSHKKDDLTLGKLAEAGDVDIAQLYDIVSGNLYKNPRDLIRIIRIEQGAQLLRTTQLSVEEVANKCDFYTPNYFIGSFFHKYKLTPKEYREELKA